MGRAAVAEHMTHRQLEALARVLTSAKRDIQDEIHDYPSQIAGCDLNFKLLIETRDLLVAALLAIGQLERGTAPADAALAQLLSELDASPGISFAHRAAITDAMAAT